MPRTDKKEMETDPFLLCWCKKIAGRPSGPALPGAIWEWVQRIHPFSFSCYIFGAINFSKYSNSRRAMSLQPHIQRLQRAHESPGDLVKMQILTQWFWGGAPRWPPNCLTTHWEADSDSFWAASCLVWSPWPVPLNPWQGQKALASLCQLGKAAVC